MKKINLGKSFVYDWPLYIILPCIAGLTISYLLNQVHQPASYEKINIFVACSSIKSKSFCDKIKNEYKDDGLKQVSTTASNPSDSVFSQKLSVVGYEGSDIFLLPYSVLSTIKASDIMLPFSASFISSYVTISNPAYFTSEEETYGLKVLNKGETIWESDYMSLIDDDYYLCLNSTSKNIGDFGIYNNPEYDLALKVFTYLEKASV
jgi:hypothetical protein